MLLLSNTAPMGKKWSSYEDETLRQAVPGGWLYLVIEKAEFGAHMAHTLAFVPKPGTAKAPKP
jgi:hypothetical protein